MMTIKHKRSNNTQSLPSPDNMEYGEIAINYRTGEERLFIKNDNNNIIEFAPNKEKDISSKPLVTFTTTSITLTPNKYYRKTNQSSSLTLYLENEGDTSILNEYLVEFTTATNGTTISLPSTIKWSNGETPTFESNTTYQISIVNNLGVCIKFK
jgi:hypothetical protein